MTAVLGLVSPGAPSTPAMVSPHLAITYSYLTGLASPGIGAPTSVWIYDGAEWVPASTITIVTG